MSRSFDVPLCSGKSQQILPYSWTLSIQFQLVVHRKVGELKDRNRCQHMPPCMQLETLNTLTEVPLDDPQCEATHESRESSEEHFLGLGRDFVGNIKTPCNNHHHFACIPELVRKGIGGVPENKEGNVEGICQENVRKVARQNWSALHVRTNQVEEHKRSINLNLFQI